MPLRVLIPSKTDSLLQRCFESRWPLDYGRQIAVIGDNGLTPEFKSKWHQAAYIDIPQPFVYSDAINRCAKEAGPGKNLLIIGDDTEFLTPDWYEAIDYLFTDWPREFGLLNISESHHNCASSGGQQVSCSLLAFVATLIPHWIWDEIGPMDTRFTGYGYDDFDYCLRVLHAGYNVGITGAAMVRHKGSGTYWSVNMREKTADNRKLFAEKWGWKPEEGFPLSSVHLNRSGCHCASVGS